MIRSLIGGGAYFVIVFAVAFALGVLRVTFVVPAIGAVWATLAELPFTLAASWATCAWISRRCGVSSTRQSIAMGASAFLLLMGAEVTGSVLIFGRTLIDDIASYGAPAGALGLAGQIAFGLFPVIQGRSRRRAAPARDGKNAAD